jgi:uncharacterized protein YwgA
MNASDLVLLVLKAFDGEIRGKTLLQKRCYFVARLCDSQRAMGFEAHYYGPYSSEVDNATGQLRALGFIEESKAAFGVTGESGFEVSRYDFTLTDDGHAVASVRKEKRPNTWHAIEVAVKRIKEAGDPNYVELSIAAKACYLLEQKKGGPASANELVELAKSFGWQIRPAQVLSAWEFLEKLDLIQIVHA